MLISAIQPRDVWLLLRTKPKQERNAVGALRERGLEAYCPRVLEPRLHKRAPVGPVPLFPSYVFAQCHVPTQFGLANYCTGVIEVVRFGEFLASVEDDFVALLQQREGERGFLAMAEMRRPLARGQRVRVLAGPFAGYEGLVEKYMPARDRVRLLLMLVSGGRSLELEARHVRCA